MAKIFDFGRVWGLPPIRGEPRAAAPRIFLILRIERKNIKIFVIFSKIVLDKMRGQWYHNRARVGEFCACTAMMQEIALKNGNFCGVCPVIGRLN